MKFKDNIKIETDDFWYDLIEGGYIKFEEMLKNEKDIKDMKEAIATLLDFKETAERKEIINYS